MLIIFAEYDRLVAVLVKIGNYFICGFIEFGCGKCETASKHADHPCAVSARGGDNIYERANLGTISFEQLKRGRVRTQLSILVELDEVGCVRRASGAVGLDRGRKVLSSETFDVGGAAD